MVTMVTTVTRVMMFIVIPRGMMSAHLVTKVMTRTRVMHRMILTRITMVTLVRVGSATSRRIMVG